MLRLFRSKQNQWFFLGILILGIVLRVWALPFGLPCLSRPDENGVSKFVIHSMLQSFFEGHPNLDPYFFHYPTLFLYMILALDALYYLIGHILGIFPDGQSFIMAYLNDWTAFHLIQRCVSALFGILSVPALAALITVVTRSRWQGILGGFVLAVCYLHVRDSHFGVTDTTATFWVIVALWMAVSYYRNGRQVWFYWATVLAGLAATTKYPMAVVLLPVWLGYIFRHFNSGLSLRQQLETPAILKPLVYSLLIFIAVFYGCSPYILLDPQKFWADILQQGGAILSTNFANLPPGWQYHTTFSLWYGMGALSLIGSGAGLIWISASRQPIKNRHIHWMLLSYFVAYFAINATTRYVYVRYAIPMIPVLIVYLCWGLKAGIHWLRYHVLSPALRLSPVFKTRMLSSLCIVLISAQSLVYSIQIDSILSQDDTRLMARRFLLSHLKPGEPVGIGLVFSHIDLPFGFQKYFLSPHQGVNEAGNPNLNYIYSPKAEVNMAMSDRHEGNMTTYTDVAALKKLGIRFVSIGLAPLPFYAVPKAELEHLAGNPELQLVAHYQPFGTQPPLPKEAYDQVDGFFVPFSRFDGMTHPGPEIWIYQVR